MSQEANVVAGDDIDQHSNRIELSTFRLGEEWFAIDVLNVQEVMEPLPISILPLAPDYIRGLINVRGLIVTSISLKKRLGFEVDNYDEEYHNIIVQSPEGPVCLMVDEIGDVVVVEKEDITERPPTIGDGSAKYIQGVFKMSAQLVVVLDVVSVSMP